MMTAAPSIWRRLDQTGVPLLLMRLVVGGYFIYMGLQKIGDPVGFLKLIHQYALLQDAPPLLLNASAIILPWTEIMCGAALVMGVFLRGAAATITGMLVVFTPLVFLRAWDIHVTQGTPFMQVAFDCGCGTGHRIIWHKLVENAGFLVVVILLLLSGSRRFCLERLLDSRRTTQLYCRLCGYVMRSKSPTCGCSRAAA